jgi:transcriptional regulator with XRE-family HTH domain
MDTKQILGSNIRAYRQLSKLTLKDLAKQVGKSYQVISKWETGENSPISSQILKLAQILHTTPNALYGIADSNATTQSDLLQIPIDLNSLLANSANLNYQGLHIPLDIRPQLIKTLEGALEMAGITKKNIPAHV